VLFVCLFDFYLADGAPYRILILQYFYSISSIFFRYDRITHKSNECVLTI